MCLLGGSGLIYVSSNIPGQAGVNYKTLKYVFVAVRQLSSPIEFQDLAATAHNETMGLVDACNYVPQSLHSACEISQQRLGK